jgi:hypothetical protein
MSAASVLLACVPGPQALGRAGKWSSLKAFTVAFNNVLQQRNRFEQYVLSF